MLQSHANDARGEAGSLRRLARLEKEKNSQTCACRKLSKGVEKSWELKILENSHCDYNEMKMRMHMEIAGLLSRMEAAIQLLDRVQICTRFFPSNMKPPDFNLESEDESKVSSSQVASNTSPQKIFS